MTHLDNLPALQFVPTHQVAAALHLTSGEVNRCVSNHPCEYLCRKNPSTHETEIARRAKVLTLTEWRGQIIDEARKLTDPFRGEEFAERLCVQPTSVTVALHSMTRLSNSIVEHVGVGLFRLKDRGTHEAAAEFKNKRPRIT